MGFTLEKCDNKQDIKSIKSLYISAFPREERAPFFMLSSKAKKGRGDMLSAKENGDFVGFAYMICHKDLAYLFYLAVNEGKRGLGYGGKILSAVKEKYYGKRIFLAREQLDTEADNYQQRVSRHNFYLSNGFEDLGIKIKEAGVIYDVMGIGGMVFAKDYQELIDRWAGKAIRKIGDMRIIDS